jgi:hypothetical protein
LKQHGYKGTAFSDATLFVEPDGLDENELGDVKNDFNISLQDFLRPRDRRFFARAEQHARRSRG